MKRFQLPANVLPGIYKHMLAMVAWNRETCPVGTTGRNSLHHNVAFVADRQVARMSDLAQTQMKRETAASDRHRRHARNGCLTLSPTS